MRVKVTLTNQEVAHALGKGSANEAIRDLGPAAFGFVRGQVEGDIENWLNEAICNNDYDMSIPAEEALQTFMSIPCE